MSSIQFIAIYCHLLDYSLQYIRSIPCHLSGASLVPEATPESCCLHANNTAETAQAPWQGDWKND